MSLNFQKIEVEKRGNVGILRLNEPAKLNAVAPLMIEEMERALDDLTSSVRAVIITGAGRAFCSGAALDVAADDPAVDRSQRDLGLFLQTHINPLMSKLRNLPVPWISAVRGAAAGVGASLALAGDMVIAGEGAYFLQAFARIGLVPDGGATHLLVRTIGRVRAMELMMLADRLPASKAHEWGLVSRVVPDAALDEEALTVASSLADGPVVTLGLIRKAVWTAIDADWEDALLNERELQRVAGRTSDVDEGIAAFNDKRRPSFKGC
jgi:2-(1,2-epoxy-1,2-dihydrophenyl)acetyl-CoA isomerase